MLQRLAVIVPTLFLAFGILLISVLRTAAVKYEFSGVVNGAGDTDVLSRRNTYIDYLLPLPGKVLPDSPLWPVKATRDRIWLATTTNPSRKVELYLLLADKRLVASKIFFENKEAGGGYSALVKAEHYLKQACEKERENKEEGIDTSEFLQRLALASLKHRQIIEEEILPIAPDDAKPEIVHALDTTRETYSKVLQALNEKGITPPENPFDRD